MIELIFANVLMLIRKVFLKNISCFHIVFFLDKGFRFEATVCKDCQDVLMMSIDINSIAISNIHGVDYRYIIFNFSKTKAICLLKKNYLCIV